jgi:uncharacterized protein (TIGR02300 family)
MGMKTMPANDLGNKFLCFKCGTKFYDLRKPEPLCPKCGANQRESPALKAPPPSERRSRAARPVVQPAAEEVEVDTEVDEEAEADEDEAQEEPGDEEP